MPQDGSMNYQYPPGTPGITDQSIESESYNTFLDDLVVNDLNIPRPIHRGGTNATTAHDAMVNLGGEIATQIVTNYDSFLFVAGSFASAPGATSAPSSVPGFSGICYPYSDPSYITIEAREFSGSGIGRKYVRQKVAGTWSAWSEQPGSSADLDARYVNVTGDTMSGDLTIYRVAAPTTGAISFGNIGGKYLFYDGTNFNFSGGAVNANANLTAANISGYAFTSALTGTTGTYYFGNTGTKYLNYDGTNYTLTGGALFTSTLDVTGNVNVSAAVTVGRSSTTGTYYFGNSGTKSLSYDGTNFSLIGGSLNISKGLIFGGAIGGEVAVDATYNAVSVGVGGTIATLVGFSGLVVTACWTSGVVELYLCGAGAVTRVSGSAAPNHTSCAYNAGAFGYSFFNNFGSTSTFALLPLRTRNSP